jgi:nitroreductase
MTVGELLRARISTRAFLDKEVPEQTVRALLAEASYAPSGGNLQPWRVHVVMSGARERLIETVKAAIAADPFADESEMAVYPPNLWEPYRTRRFAIGEEMYALLGIPREDRPARLQWLAKNFELFGAPVGLFFSLDRRFDKPQWAHLGMFMQSLALCAVERGLAVCMQEAWQRRCKTVSRFLALPEMQQLYCGMALGYADLNAPVNSLRSQRAPLEEFAEFVRE